MTRIPTEMELLRNDEEMFADLKRAMNEDADEIIALRKENAELVAVLEVIADLGHGSAASHIARSALDTMRLLNDPRRTD